jgi:hypothetical protein
MATLPPISIEITAFTANHLLTIFPRVPITVCIGDAFLLNERLTNAMLARQTAIEL